VPVGLHDLGDSKQGERTHRQASELIDDLKGQQAAGSGRA
jgi:hypothetical protein